MLPMIDDGLQSRRAGLTGRMRVVVSQKMNRAKSNSKHLTSVVVSRFASIPSGPRAVAPFSERESAPLLGVLCLSQRSCAVGFLFALAVAVFFFLYDSAADDSDDSTS